MCTLTKIEFLVDKWQIVRVYFKICFLCFPSFFNPFFSFFLLFSIYECCLKCHVPISWKLSIWIMKMLFEIILIKVYVIYRIWILPFSPNGQLSFIVRVWSESGGLYKSYLVRIWIRIAYLRWIRIPQKSSGLAILIKVHLFEPNHKYIRGSNTNK